MQEIRKALKLNEESYYEIHLSLINCLLPKKYILTPMEIKVIAAFMKLKGDIAQYRFGPSAKKIVMEQLGLSSSGLSNHMKSLLIKGHLIKRGDMISILPLLNPEPNEQLYMFKLINDNNHVSQPAEASHN